MTTRRARLTALEELWQPVKVLTVADLEALASADLTTLTDAELDAYSAALTRLTGFDPSGWTDDELESFTLRP